MARVDKARTSHSQVDILRATARDDIGQIEPTKIATENNTDWKQSNQEKHSPISINLGDILKARAT